MSERRREWWVLFLCAACQAGGGETETSSGTASPATTTGETSTPETSTAETASETSAGPSGETSAGPTSSATSGETPTSGGPTGGETTAGETSGDTSGGETSRGETSMPATSGDTSGGRACEGEDHAGQATYYAADGSGNCSFPADPSDDMVAAMNTVDYMAAAVCGACVQIDGPDGQITVRIVDRCPECQQGHIDLDEDAFPMIAAKDLGIVPITWRYVSCPVEGPIAYHFKEGSSQWWTAVQVRNHRDAIATFEFKDAGDQWQAVPRLDYNYFVAEAGMGPGPLTFRVTDVHGNVVEDAGVPLLDDAEAPGSAQFPGCAP